MTRSNVSYVESIKRACEVIRQQPFDEIERLDTRHRSYVHAWSDGFYPPTKQEQSDVEATVFAAGSTLLSDGLTAEIAEKTIEAIVSVEHKSFVTDALADLISKTVPASSDLTDCLENVLLRALSKSDSAAFLRSRVVTDTQSMTPGPEERRRQLIACFEYLPLMGVKISARLLYNLDAARFISVLSAQTDIFSVTELMAGIPIDAAFSMATDLSSPQLREIALVRVTSERNEAATVQAVTECLRVSLSDPLEWSDRVKAFLSWPMYPGHDRMLLSFGRVLAAAEHAALVATLSSLPIDLPGENAKIRFLKILDGVEAEGGKTALKRFCRVSYERREAWLDRYNDSTLYPPISWLDTAVEEHIRSEFTLKMRHDAIAEIRRKARADDRKHFVSPIDKRAAHYRHLATYQPFVKASKANARGLPGDSVALYLDLVGADDHAYYALRYDYVGAERAWSQSR